ncbi:HNH endonuclease [bacterium]|nr:HNH endonuclease [bacterium]
MLSAYLGITDNSWFDHLRRNQITDEVNFWVPSAPARRHVEPGSLWLFKLHSPLDFIVGAGVFMHYSVLPLQLAWDVFGIRNGVPTLDAFRKAIMWHKQPGTDSWNTDVGCAVLDQVVYLPRELWVPCYTGSVVSGKHMASVDDQAVVRQVLRNLELTPSPRPFYNDSYTPQHALCEVRQGQGTFRVQVTDAYHRQCAASREHSLPVLEAAHIIEWSETHANDVTNGILLRADIHKLFDAGYVTIDPDGYRFVVSKRLKEDYDNGKEYYQLHGTRILLPEKVNAWPDRDALIQHGSHVFSE